MSLADCRSTAATPDHLYHAYGLLIASRLPLPEMPPAVGTGTPDLVIEVGEIHELAPPAAPPDARRIGPFLWASAEQLWLEVPDIARFRVSGGREIMVQPAPGSDADGVRTFLLGTALGMLLTQRGHLMLHANAIRIGAGCVVCAGRSGAGKSTLAAGFERRGFAVLTDDLALIDAHQHVIPGIPQVKLWADMTRAMGVGTASLRRVRAQLEKFAYPLERGFADAPAPVRAVYSLTLTNGENVGMQRLAGFAKLQTVRAYSYRPQLVDAVAGRERHLTQCARLAATTRVATLLRPARGFTLDRLIDAILADLEAPG